MGNGISRVALHAHLPGRPHEPEGESKAVNILLLMNKPEILLAAARVFGGVEVVDAFLFWSVKLISREGRSKHTSSVMAVHSRSLVLFFQM